MKQPALRHESWQAFRDAGLLWFVNRVIHLFGWAIVITRDSEGNTTCHPARTCWRGFSIKAEEDGYIKLTRHIRDSMPEMIDVVDSMEKEG